MQQMGVSMCVSNFFRSDTLPGPTAFAKMGPLCQLEERHGIDLGQGYKNELACATFIDYIAQEQRQGLAASLSRARFFGLQADGSTDAGNIEDEVFLAVYCDPRAANGRVHVRINFFPVRHPARANAEGLFVCLNYYQEILRLDNTIQ